MVIPQKIRPYILLIILFVFFQNCQRERSKINSLPEMEFEVIPTNLGLTYQDSLGFKFNPPKGCSLVKEDYSLINYDTILTYPFEVKAAFLDSLTQTIVVVSDISKLLEKDYLKILKAPKQFFDKKKEWTEIKTAQFSFRKQIITQFLLQNSSLVNFKLLLYEGIKNRYQIDYFIPTNHYSSQAKLIESSIGSIRLNSKNLKSHATVKK